MLIIHIGMPKTGTTAIQRLLATSVSLLAEGGYLYPELWRNQENIAHHLLGSTLLTTGSDAEIFEELRSFLRGHRDRNVLLSTESLSNALSVPGFPALYDLLRSCSEIMPVKVVCSVRRMDSFFTSMYLHDLKVSGWQGPVDEYVDRRFQWMDQFFAKLRQLELAREAAILDLLPYKEGGDSVRPLLARLGVDQIIEQGKALPRENVRLGLKAQSFLAYYDEFTSSTPIKATKGLVIRMLESRAFEFSGEVFDYDILDYHQRRCVHEFALRKAFEYGVHMYHQAFAGATIRRCPTKSVLDRNIVSQVDIKRLAEAVAQVEEASRAMPTPETQA